MTVRSPGEGVDREQDLIEAVTVCLEEGATDQLKDMLTSVPAADVAAVLRELGSDMPAEVFRLLDADFAAEVLDELDEQTVHIIAAAAPTRLREAVERMEPDEAVDVLEVLPEKQAEAILDAFPQGQATAAERLLTYPPDTAGGLMTTEFVLLYQDVTARKAIEITQRSRETETVAHLFVADQNDRLVGHLPLQHLVFAPPEQRVGELMEEYPHAVSPDTDQEELVRAATKYDLEVVPVVEDNGKLIGLVTVDDILEAAQQEMDEDMYRLAGTGERDPVHASIYRSTRLRLPWLLLSVLDGLFIAFVVSRFEGTLRVIQLSFFIPLIPLMGGNVAIQASTIVVRGLALGHIRRRMLSRFLLKQLVITLLLSLCCGVTAGLLGAVFVGTGARIMMAVGFAVCISIVVAGMLGMTLPLAFNAVGLDPAVSAGPFITMLNDLFCISIYLVLGMLIA
ncbi:MAG: magnesium transporter [Candidatus Brocadiae bacterium]|nr:magnesium transporter [Candidatus Brocadiia bacterium]